MRTQLAARAVRAENFQPLRPQLARRIIRPLLAAALGLAITFTLSCSGDGNGASIPNPDPPAGVTATATSTSSIDIGWGSVSGAAGYYIYRSTSTIGPYEQIGSSKSTFYADNGLQSGTTYYYRVAGYNSSGTGSQSYQAGVTTIPSYPSGVVASASSANSVIVSWGEVSGATGYRIYRDGAQAGTSTTNSYTNTGLTAETGYSYWVTAYNGGGESEKSSTVYVTVLPSSSSSRPPSSSSVVPSSSSIQHVVIPGTPVTYGGESYQTVVIGTQTWMAKNLNYNAEGSKCYDDDTANCSKYGRLYDWATAMALPSDCNSTSCSSQINAKHRGICPSGWHIPSNADWDKLVRYVDGTNGTSSPYDSPTAGRYLKATSGWNSNGNGTDALGFAALPGGNGNSYGTFSNVGYYGYWWSATEYGASYAYHRYMYYYGEYVGYLSLKYYLFSVRCLQD